MEIAALAVTAHVKSVRLADVARDYGHIVSYITKHKRQSQCLDAVMSSREDCIRTCRQ
jgi:hypothetical protein